MTQASVRAVRSVRSFRPSALALALPATPLAIGWGMGFYGSPPPGVTHVALGAHWIVSWLLPPCLVAILSYGTAGMGADRRIAVSGPRDIRQLWWATHATVVVAALFGAVAVATWLARWSGEPALSLAVPAVAGAALALAAAQICVARLGFGPGQALGVSVSVVGVAAIAPYFVAPLSWLALDSTLRHWIWVGQGRPSGMQVGAAIWLAAAAVAVLVARLFPRDPAGLPWLAKEVESS